MMNKKIKNILIILLLTANFSCFDDGSTPGPKGTLKIMVNTSGEIYSYPKLKDGSTTDYQAYKDDVVYTWQYPEVGKAADVTTLINILNNLGSKINIVYLASTLPDTSKDWPILYRGESSNNNEEIIIKDIVPGTYYVVAFYDYSTGGQVTNLLNSYDRYATYTETNVEAGTVNSTPFQDYASTITIEKDKTTSITLDIGRDWVLGKPASGMGRVFLKSTDPIPTPDGTHP